MILINGHIMAMDAQPIPNGYIRVENGKIDSLGPMDEIPGRREGEELLELGGRLVLPGFIDAHCHLGLFEDGLGFEGDDLNEDTDPVTPHIRAMDGVNPFDRGFSKAREAGVTCVVVSPGSANPIGGQVCALKTRGRWVEEMLVAQPLAIKFALGENPKMSYSNKSQAPVTRMATVAFIREQLFKARRYLEDKLDAIDDPDQDEPDFDARCEALIPLLEGKIPAHFHAHKAYDILSAVRIAKEFSLEYSIVHCTEGYLIADILAGLDAKAICGPMVMARTKPELANHSAENCGALARAGVTVAVSTDYPESPADFLAASAAIAAANGMPREKALESITIAAAKAVGLEHRLGSISPGKDADLAVFTMDPLSVGAKPDIVMIDGEIIV